MSDEETKDVVSIFDLCETDTKAEEEGRWFRDIFEDGTNIDIKLRRLTSRPVMQARRRLEKGYRKHLKNGKMPEELSVKILIEQMAEAVILDWKGIYDKEKKEIPYTKENAVALLTRLVVFRDSILRMANDLDNFRIEEQEETAKN